MVESSEFDLFLFLARSSLTRPGLTLTGVFHVPYFPALMTFHVFVNFTIGHGVSGTSTTIAGEGILLRHLRVTRSMDALRLR